MLYKLGYRPRKRKCEHVLHFSALLCGASKERGVRVNSANFATLSKLFKHWPGVPVQLFPFDSELPDYNRSKLIT